MTQGIYAITNKCNGHQYVGQSGNVESRWKGHKTLLSKGTHYSLYLQHAWDKYGHANFTFSILEKVKNECNLDDQEQYWIERLHPVYNIIKNVREWYSYKADSMNLPDGLPFQEETFTRPAWHRWVYGGAENPNK
jgi:group I intron endonuclease